LEGAIPVYETGNIVGYTNLKIEKDDKDKSNFAFLVCNYNPTLKYETIIGEYERKLANDERRKTEIQNRMKEIGFSYDHNLNN
jgi:hypothetical protein